MATQESELGVRTLEDLFRVVDFKPNSNQRKAVSNTEGPELIIAGPGSGKTQVLVLRCLNLLLFHKVDPSKILICTYTEKASASLQDRIRRAVRDAGAESFVDLSELWIGTIHSICAELINEYIDETWLVKGYEVLDELTQQLFLHEYFYDIIGKPEPLSTSHWGAIKQAVKYFTKITEDLVDVDRMKKSDDHLASIARKYERYEKQLRDTVSVDFAHLQKIVLDLLDNPHIGPVLRQKFSYIMVDEYQDTNFIQERIFLKLSEGNRNICVVGDEDQSLYRFRGATVQNFLHFPKNFKTISIVKLEDNYRSTPQIVDFVNNFIRDMDWHDSNGKEFRFNKRIRASKPAHPGMQSVYSITDNPVQTVAKLIRSMKDSGVVSDLNQISILLRSVANDGPDYFAALTKEKIKYYAPRARAYFEQREVKALIGTLLYITDFLKNEASWNNDLTTFYNECLTQLSEFNNADLNRFLSRTKDDFSQLLDDSSLKKGIVDVFYETIANQPFFDWAEDPTHARNLAIFSDLLTKFQEHYRLPVIRGNNLERLRRQLFNSFLYAMWEMGLDEYEDPYDVFPPGYVQIMTIHQAKGLEFPVIVVGSLDKHARSETKIDRELEPYGERKTTEPYDQISAFDHHRLFYVAFSRAMDLLLLACDGEPSKQLEPAVRRAPNLTSSDRNRIMKLKFEKKEFLPPKPEFSISSHIHAYDVCPRQYMYYGEYGFTGARSAGETFGTLVHNTIEDIHLHYLKKKGKIDEKVITAYFERNSHALTRGGVHPLAKIFHDMAFNQVLRYFENNKNTFDKLIKTEEPILVQRPDYVMSGIIDLIRGTSGELELLDFKAQKKEDLTDRRMQFYKFQLSIYARMIERKRGERPQRTYIYLTAEPDINQALTPIPIHEVEAEEAETSFDQLAHKILRKDFQVTHEPPRDVCRNCDFRYRCPDRKGYFPDIRT
jgi:DNA helicase-2/ATP-dependent DNA helicase PcrA